MSLLVIQIPARARLGARQGHAEAARVTGWARADTELEHVFSLDGRQVTRVGRAPLAALPRAETVLAVVADGDISWHQINIPKAPPARLRAALAGAMEELLLEDEEQLHFALAADAVPGQRGWVAVLHKPWLAAWLALLDGAGLNVERVLASSRPVAPGAPAQGHFFLPAADLDTAPTADAIFGANALQAAALDPAPPESTVDPQQPLLVLSREDGVACVRLHGALARALQPAPDQLVHWTATPAAAAAAEAWLGSAVVLRSEAERLLELAGGGEPGLGAPDNLRQFDLVARHRGSRAFSAGLRRLLSPAWRPVRVGVAVLLLLQLVGLNAYAWQQRQALAEQRAAMTQLLRETHPGVRAVLDAPLQMARETERLRAAAGRPGDSDLEALLAAAAAAWPEGQGPVQTLRFESGRLTLAAAGWRDDELAQFRQRLQAGGYSAELADDRVTLSRAPGAGLS